MLHITISKRAALMIAVALILVVPGVATATHVFTDVADTFVHAPGIEWLAATEVTAGCEDGTKFCPNDAVSRAQMATFMHRLSGNAVGVSPSVDAATLGGLDSSVFVKQADLVLPSAVHAGGNETRDVTDVDVVVRSVTVVVPADGVVVVNSTTSAFEETAGDEVRCSITDGTTMDFDFRQIWENVDPAGSNGVLAGTRGFDVTAGGDLTVNLVCDHGGSSIDSEVYNSALTAMFFPNP